MSDTFSTGEQLLRSARAFVFDFYGTLVEDDVSVSPMWEDLNRLGYNSGPDLQAMFEPDGFDGSTTPDFGSNPSHDDWNKANWRQFVRLSGVPPENVDAVLEHLLGRQDAFRAKAAPGALEILELLRRHDRKIGLCSNWESPIGRYLKQAGLPRFDAISISADVGARKPHIAVFRDVCAKLGVDGAGAVLVGDNWSSDIVGALRAGMTPVWIRGQKATRGLSHLVAEFPTLPELEAYMRKVILKPMGT